MGSIRFSEVASTSRAVSAESGRSAKRDLLAVLLGSLDPSEPHEVEAVVGMLTGEPRQGRIGVGWATVAGLEVSGEPAGEALTVGDVDRLVDALDATRGAGSQTRRRDLLLAALARASADEADHLRRLFTGEMRQGALDGVMTDAVARAAEVPATVVRRAVMLGGDLGEVARLALTEGRAGLEAVGLRVGRPVNPMLASTAASVAAAVDEIGRASVEWKLDGIRIQVHRRADRIAVYTRNLNDITDRVPSVVAAVRDLDVASLVVDGEALAVDEQGRPWSFPDIAGEVARHDDASATTVRPFLFDVLHHDGVDLVDEPLSRRLEVLDAVASHLRVPSTVTADPGEAEQVLVDALAAGHEGVVAKSLTSPYAAGRRGKAWRKVKPAHTLDLVVIAVEWGHGRRTGTLSNLWLGARDPDATDLTTAEGFVMVGKTFKGLTDELLAWQTAELGAREVRTDGHVVHVRPELVVEIAVDGVLPSPRYPGGVALRFARVRGYRHDKPPAQADTIGSVQSLLR